MFILKEKEVAMKIKHCAAWTVILAILFAAVPAGVFAQAPAEVYTRFVRTSAGRGSGTISDPFNFFEDALNAVAEGGTIYILDSAFVNYHDDGSPLAITKPVTITGAPNLGYRPSFTVRTAGIILGADVTFDTVSLDFTNGFRPVICANGYTLNLYQSTYSQSTRIVHLAGGGMYGYSDLAPGSHSRITVSGKNSRIGNFYAGSINGTFDKPVDITVDQVASENVGDIYACGAREGYYNDENFMDPSNEPEFPQANADLFPSGGTVSVHINETSIHAIYGATGGSKNAAVSIASQYPQSCALTDIDALEITRGTCMPTALNHGTDITVHPGAALDIGCDVDGIPVLGNLVVRTFTGGGTLLMGYDQTLTITGDCLGETEFRTRGGSQFQSNLARPEYLYIKTGKGDGTFTFNPCYVQQGMTFTKDADGWRTGSQPASDATVLSSFSIPEPVQFISQSEIASGFEVPIEATFAQGIDEIAYVPFDYTVRFGGEEYTVFSIDIDGYYEAEFEPLHMHFMPAGNSIYINNFSTAFEPMGDIAPGVYDFDIIAPLQTQSVICPLRLVVLEDGQPTPPLTVNNTRGRIDVTYYNTTGKDIQNAVLTACAYDDTGVLKAIFPAAEPLSAVAGKSQSISFDMKNSVYHTIKIFAWDGFAGLIPLCTNYQE